MASVRKHRNKYEVRYYVQNDRGERKSHSEMYKTEKEALIRKAEIELEKRKGEFIPPSTKSLGEFMTDWLQLMAKRRDWAPKTLDSNTSLVQNQIIPFIGKVKMCNLNTRMLENLYADLRRTPCGLYVQGQKRVLSEKAKKRCLSGTTVHEVHKLLKDALDSAVEWKIIKENPVPQKAPAKDTQETASWDRETMISAFQSMEENPLLHLAVHLTLIGALREGEVSGLQISDIDFDAENGKGVFHVCKSMQRVAKKAFDENDAKVLHVFPEKVEGSASVVFLKCPKTKGSKRDIIMTANLKEELLRWMQQIKRYQADDPAGYQNSGMLLQLPNGNFVEPNLLRKYFERWREEHPQYRRITYHGLRHSAASYLYYISGYDEKTVQKITGHTNVGTLMNTYVHDQKTERRKLVETVEQDFYSGGKKSTEEVRGIGSLEALLVMLEQADPETKQKLRLKLLA